MILGPVRTETDADRVVDARNEAVVDDLEGAPKADARVKVVEEAHERVRLGLEQVIRMGPGLLDGGDVGLRVARGEEGGGDAESGQK
jgi:hypothetical protein